MLARQWTPNFYTKSYPMTTVTAITRFWGEMAFLDSGESGIPILFLHGTGCDSTDWKSVIEKLPSDQRSITLDFRGHGHSSVPIEPFTLDSLGDDVLYLADAIGIQEVILVGHSLGGMVAMDVAKRSSQVVGLILLEGWTRLSSAGSAFDPGRFYGSLDRTAITQIQQKAGETRGKFKPSVWESFWTSVKDLMLIHILKKHVFLFMKCLVEREGMNRLNRSCAFHLIPIFRRYGCLMPAIIYHTNAQQKWLKFALIS